MKEILYPFLASLLLLTSCSCETEVSVSQSVKFTPVSTNGITRFEIQSQGKFNAGYNNSIREVLLIKDTKTGQEYLGITDVSLIKLIQSEREKALDVLETAIDVASGISGE